ncbi:MAG: hypothetical protein ABIK08_15145 [Pseudomonadota bacterium]
MLIRLFAVIGLAAPLLLNPAWGADLPESHAISEFIVHYRNGDQTQAVVALSGAQRAMDMGTRVGENLAYVRATKEGHLILRSGRTLNRAQAWEIATRMAQQGGVESAYPIDPDLDVRPPARPPIK